MKLIFTFSLSVKSHYGSKESGRIGKAVRHEEWNIHIKANQAKVLDQLDHPVYCMISQIILPSPCCRLSWWCRSRARPRPAACRWWSPPRTPSRSRGCRSRPSERKMLTNTFGYWRNPYVKDDGTKCWWPYRPAARRTNKMSLRKSSFIANFQSFGRRQSQAVAYKKFVCHTTPGTISPVKLMSFDQQSKFSTY